MDSVQKVPQTEVAEGHHMGYAKKKSSGMKRPKVLKKGSAATKRYMAHLRSLKKSAKKAKTPARKSRKTPARRGRKPGPKKGSRKTPKRSSKTPMRKSSKKQMAAKRMAAGKAAMKRYAAKKK